MLGQGDEFPCLMLGWRASTGTISRTQQRALDRVYAVPKASGAVEATLIAIGGNGERRD
jgi:galactokinase/mevalonate kinase-like predicted kinase